MQHLLATLSGVPVEVKDEFRRTPLYYASAYGHLNCVKTLLKHGARRDTSDVNRWTPIMAATKHNHAEIVKLLLDCEADINTVAKGNLNIFICKNPNFFYSPEK